MDTLDEKFMNILDKQYQEHINEMQQILNNYERKLNDWSTDINNLIEREESYKKIKETQLSNLPI